MIRTTILLLCLLTLQQGDRGKKDLEAMQGDWASERFVSSGTTLDDDDAQAYFRTVKGNTYTVFRYRKKVGSGTFTLDTSKTPAHIDLVPANAPKGTVVKGIYKLEKGTLTVCNALPGKERPKVFESKPDSGHTLFVWKKEKK
jgi:uncharacterized protein (TIGR03067 family)